MKKLEGNVAVITGGSSGIGLASAKLFKAEGAKVVISGRSQETLNEALKELGSDNVLAVQGDVAKIADIEKLIAETVKTFGRIDVLFANAGIGRFAPIEATTEEIYDEQMNINVKGVFFTIQKALPYLNDGASVIINTSIVNEMGMHGASIYSATKAAARSLARTLSAELIAKGIRVNAISPGPIETGFFSRTNLPKEATEAFAQNVLGSVPMKRFGKSEEVAKAVLFFATSDSSYILGTELAVDGGMSQL